MLQHRFSTLLDQHGVGLSHLLLSINSTITAIGMYYGFLTGTTKKKSKLATFASLNSIFLKSYLYIRTPLNIIKNVINFDVFVD